MTTDEKLDEILHELRKMNAQVSHSEKMSEKADYQLNELRSLINFLNDGTTRISSLTEKVHKIVSNPK